jgi:phosphoglycerate dehydrogenase-like enzyme
MPPRTLIVISDRFFDQTYGPEGLQAIRERVHLLREPLGPDDLAAEDAALAETEVLFSGWNAPVLDAAFLARCPKLRAVFYAGGSVRYFVTDEVWRRGITVSSAYAINGEAVADYTVGAVLFSLKQGFAHARAAKRGAFAANITVPGVYGAAVGLVSLGATGRAVAQKLAPFDVHVLAYDPFVAPAEAAALGVELVPDLEHLFAAAEVVSLHTPLLPSTTGLVRGVHFTAMRPGATFINTARGAVVREAEMVAALRARPDLTAILDVTDPEPPVADSPLYTLSNVFLTPHVAGAVERECRRMGGAMIAEFDRWQRGEPLLHAIRPDRLSLMA